MKKFNKIFLILFVLTLILPLNAKALTKKTDLISINEKSNLSADDLSFSNISYTSSETNFGVTADVVNNSDEQIKYFATVNYYDENKQTIGIASSTNYATVGNSQLNQMSNISILNSHSMDEIKYYRFMVDIVEETLIGKNGYSIEAYDIKMVVNENNTFDITETITANFDVQKHGIIRKIPLRNKIVRLDGTSSSNRAEITNISVDNNYSVSKSNGMYNIQIGDPDKTLMGKQTYVIKYTYNIGKDPINGYDELYYNIIGNEWDTVIDNLTFSITMPKDFDASKLGFSYGNEGSTESEKAQYTVNGNQITGSYDGILNPGEAFTVRCELPEGYFVGAKNPTNNTDYLMFVVPAISLIISFILWFLFGRDKKTVETVEFYPPQGFNSLEVGFIYKGKADKTDVTSLLIYLADKGYIQISETEEKFLFSSSKGFKITKLKEYDGNNVNERLFLEGLFKKSNYNEVTLSELYNNFYIIVNQILTNVNSKENKQKIFEKKSTNKKIFVILLMLASYILITTIPTLTYGSLQELIFGLLFPGIGFSVLFAMVFEDNNITIKIFGIFWGLLFGGIPWLTIILPVISQEPLYLIGYLFGVICIIGMALCLKYLPKRTTYGLELLGKIKGFKTYLETAEKSRLESMVLQNPNYFYDILPYAYVLGVSDKWISKFEGITLSAPNWYTGSGTFSVATFGTFMNTAMTSANAAMSSSPSSSGSSGGGSAGGGSGGGGGSSW